MGVRVSSLRLQNRVDRFFAKHVFILYEYNYNRVMQSFYADWSGAGPRPDQTK